MKLSVCLFQPQLLWMFPVSLSPLFYCFVIFGRLLRFYFLETEEFNILNYSISSFIICVAVVWFSWDAEVKIERTVFFFLLLNFSVCRFRPQWLSPLAILYLTWNEQQSSSCQATYALATSLTQRNSNDIITSEFMTPLLFTSTLSPISSVITLALSHTSHFKLIVSVITITNPIIKKLTR